MPPLRSGTITARALRQAIDKEQFKDVIEGRHRRRALYAE